MWMSRFVVGESPETLVARLAREKALAVQVRYPSAQIVGADTVVVCDREILGKPASHEDGGSMLRKLSGRTHQVLTGVCLLHLDTTFVECSTTDVTFCPLTDPEIETYLQSGEPFDKAGAYAIQGLGARFVERIDGCYFNVVGLPVPKAVSNDETARPRNLPEAEELKQHDWQHLTMMDNLSLEVLVNELRIRLLNAEIHRIRLTSDRTLILALRSRVTEYLILSLQPGSPALCVAPEEIPSETSPSDALVALRKYLVGGKITALRKSLADRVIFLEIENCRLSDRAERFILAMELIPNRAKACLLNSEQEVLVWLSSPRAFRHLFTTPNARLPRGFNRGTRVSQLVRESRGCSRIVSRLRTQRVVRPGGVFPKPARLGKGLASAASASAARGEWSILAANLPC